jgi:hypothetical protein
MTKLNIKNNWGGKRTPGEGKQIGRPKKVTGGRSVTFYIDQATQDLLRTIAPTPSEAIRLLASNYKVKSI